MTRVRESLNLGEFIAHYLQLGFDRVIVIDQCSNPSLQESPLLSEWIAQFPVTVVPGGVGLAGNVSVRSFIHLIDRFMLAFPRIVSALQELQKIERAELGLNAALSVEWLLHVDSDEYLVLHPRFGSDLQYRQLQNGQIQHLKGSKSPVSYFLEAYKTSSNVTVGQIGVNWVIFGSSYFDRQPSGFTAKRKHECHELVPFFLRCKKRFQSLVKSFARIDVIDARKPTHPHHFFLHDDNTTIAVVPYGNNTWLAGEGQRLWGAKTHKNIEVHQYASVNLNIPATLAVGESDAFIAHFKSQSAEEYFRRRDSVIDHSEKVRKALLKAFHKKHNDADCAGLVRDRYEMRTRQITAMIGEQCDIDRSVLRRAS